MTDLENFNTLNHARKLLWHFPCYRYEFLTIIEIMYELEMYMYLNLMAILVVEFSHRGYKIERFCLRINITQRKFLNFENWTNGKPQ